MAKTPKSPTIRPAPNLGCPAIASKAEAIVRYAHESAASLLSAFSQVRAKRIQGLKVKGGASTDEEQDLLRAMLVLAAAGLDATVKQFVRDCLPGLVGGAESIRAEFETFTARAVRDDPDILARVLCAESPRAELLAAFTDRLAGGSLQSVSELRKVLKALGVDARQVIADEKILHEVFEVRNAIVHGFDINFSHPTRNRQSRKVTVMTRYTNVILELTEKILGAAAAQLTALGSGGV